MAKSFVSGISSVSIVQGSGSGGACQCWLGGQNPICEILGGQNTQKVTLSAILEKISLRMCPIMGGPPPPLTCTKLRRWVSGGRLQVGNWAVLELIW